jgi:hypothetical protein
VYARKPAKGRVRRAGAQQGAGPVEGFGVDAYVHNASLGFIFMVCDGDRPFELFLDGIDGDDIPMAIALATLARNR